MPKPTAQDCHSLITYFSSRCEAAGTKVKFNRNKARWGFESILLDYTKEEARALIDYYVEHWEKLDMDWFLYNYEKVEEDMEDRAEREARQKKIREDTQKRLESWRERW